MVHDKLSLYIPSMMLLHFVRKKQRGPAWGLSGSAAPFFSQPGPMVLQRSCWLHNLPRSYLMSRGLRTKAGTSASRSFCLACMLQPAPAKLCCSAFVCFFTVAWALVEDFSLRERKGIWAWWHSCPPAHTEEDELSAEQ